MLTVDALYPAADRAASLVRRYGWTRDDCRQEAWFVLQRMNAAARFQELPSDADRIRYAGKAVARWCVRKAQGFIFDSLGGEHMILTDQHDLIARVEFNDLVQSAPGVIKDYLVLRCVEQRTWDETRERMMVSNDSLAKIRQKAAEWLLSEYES